MGRDLTYHRGEREIFLARLARPPSLTSLREKKTHGVKKSVSLRRSNFPARRGRRDI